GIVGGSGNDFINVGGNLGFGGMFWFDLVTDVMVASVLGVYWLFYYGGTVLGVFDGIIMLSVGMSVFVYTDIFV
ncbi:hypothetical protein, partial [Klebsiella pneumoniae]|uniref:hypothetical protein n=1 Tax=Klebsiella pneumoniae TaxID=573 RepID=UPI0013A543D6